MNDTCPLLAPSTHASRTFPNPPVDLAAIDDAGRVILSGGCFWCTEAVYRQLAGVAQVTSGYTGGSPETANYEAVSTGTTDHAEAVCIEYDPVQITFGAILKVFFSTAHNPTQKDQQGNDVGRHYRSAIFYETQGQRRAAEAYIDLLQSSGLFRSPIVTTLEPFRAFYPAEAQFQNYVALNPTDPYVQKHSLQKVKKTRAWYAGALTVPESREIK